MMLSSKYNIISVLSPVDAGAATTQTQYVDLDLANWVNFLIQFGNLTSDDTDVISLTVECSTAGTSNATEEAIGFTYRISPATATNTGWGTTTVATSDGKVGTSDGFNSTDLANCVVEVSIDPAAVAAKAADMRWVRCVIASQGPITILGALAFVETRYPGATIPSSS
jgi:hypothetical protein